MRPNRSHWSERVSRQQFEQSEKRKHFILPRIGCENHCAAPRCNRLCFPASIDSVKIFIAHFSLDFLRSLFTHFAFVCDVRFVAVQWMQSQRSSQLQQQLLISFVANFNTFFVVFSSSSHLLRRHFDHSFRSVRFPVRTDRQDAQIVLTLLTIIGFSLAPLLLCCSFALFSLFFVCLAHSA